MNRRAEHLRDVLAYHRRRMQCLAQCIRDGDQPCAHTINLDTDSPVIVLGRVRSELKPDWGPVLACDLGIPKDLKRSGSVLDPQKSEAWAEFDDIRVIDPSVRDPFEKLCCDFIGLDSTTPVSQQDRERYIPLT